METPIPLVFGRSPLHAMTQQATGRLVSAFGDEYYVIEDAQTLAPFLTSIVGDSDHWLFVASNGALTAGRGNPANALFPYVTEDKLYDAAGVTGPTTSLIVTRAGAASLWHPLRPVDQRVYGVTQRLYKSVLGNRLVIEEENRDLGLCFRAAWSTSDRFGFVRECTLVNRGSTPVHVRVLDGLLNLMPGDVSEPLQLGYSCLVDAFKKHERVPGTTLALYTLAAQVVDRAEPVEALHATVVWSHGLGAASVHLGDEAIARFDRGEATREVDLVRGGRGAYLTGAEIALAPGAEQRWLIVADVAQTQAAVARLITELGDPASAVAAVRADLAASHARLRRIVAGTDALQRSADRNACAHHVANVLFNDMRGGVFAHGNAIPGPDFAAFVRGANRVVGARHEALLDELPALEPHAAHRARLAETGDPELLRLADEYLPLTFSRRHGDPSRPWNRFDIRVRDARGDVVLDYQGNWRDIFQNWEALGASYPAFLEQMVAKFVNASTLDGHNPYRVGRHGIDWEVPDPDHPWATIGYWGDHQIVYLARLLELSLAHHPDGLRALLQQARFSYADVPYRIRPFAEILVDPRATIVFDAARHAQIVAREAELGSDARLVHDSHGVVRATLIEKLLVPALAKLANFVPGGGIWMNTQRPEWNDANNALVGYGVSMVTACYLERYLALVDALLAPLADDTAPITREVAGWIEATAHALEANRALAAIATIDDRARWRCMSALGEAASAYRARIYAAGITDTVAVPIAALRALIARAGQFVRHTIASARRADGLVHAYSVLVPGTPETGWGLEPLAEMLEGQVAALSTRALDDAAALAVLDALPASRLYRADQRSYLLYPDRRLPTFLEKNVIPPAVFARAPLLQRLVDRGDTRIALCDAQGQLRFAAEHTNAAACDARLRRLRADGELDATDDEIAAVLAVYEEVFHHRAFTGRSGTMFAYEGLGSIYWHMVGKLLLATQERFLAAVEGGADPAIVLRFVGHYEAIRAAMSGVEKSPAAWGAFPLDPYSHSPARGGARQPGMTGQVKEEILVRMGELGIRVRGGCVAFRPRLLRRAEFLTEPAVFEPYAIDGAPLRLELAPGTLAFTYCQVPVVYHLSDTRRIALTVDGAAIEIAGDALDAAWSAEVFERTGRVARIDVFTAPGR
ncbi:MAG: hypothetical protein K8W52_36140 [Deltaproteobacteria bacterium]|nr:hypothetical protein [Deltaproteobacteria bacterium]